MRRSTFAQAPTEEGAAALNRVFEQYLVPVAFSADQMHLHMTYNDVDASASPLWYDEDGSVVAAALLGIRGQRGWIGGFGVAPEHRGQGYASRLVEAVKITARERGLRSIQLEVLTDNAAAINVYRRAGFTIARTLRSFERLVEEANEANGFGTRSVDEYIDLADSVRPCWQREQATLRKGAVSTAVGNGSDYALFRYNPHAAQVLKLAASDARSIEMLASAAAAGRDFQRVLVLNEPEESPIVRHARTARWNEPFVQYEMILNLD